MNHIVKVVANVDKTAWKQEMTILSDKLGKLGLIDTPLQEVSEMVLKSDKNPISMEINVSFRFKWIEQCWKIEQQLGFNHVMDFAKNFPTIDKLCNQICGEIYGYAHNIAETQYD